MTPSYQHTRGAIYVVVPVGEGKLRLRAEAVRKERTGIHSRIEIWWEKQRLTYDQFNVERQEERRRLMRGAYKLLPSEAKELITEDQAIMELDMFCADLWAAHVGSIEVDVEMPGDINIPPPRMMGPYVIEEGGCIIHGQPGSGKSWCLYCILQSINHGCSAIWPVRTQERVLLVNLERSAKSVQQRMGCVNRTLGLPLDAPMDILNLRGHSLKDAADAARNHCEKYGVTVLGLDSISRAGLGSLNRDEVANEVIDLMNSICPTWIALGHQAKPDPEAGGSATNFGSQMFYAGADMMVRLESEPIWNGNLNVTMTIDKANVLVDKHPAHFLYEMDAVGLSRVSSGASKQVTVQEVYDALGDGSNWAGSVAAQLEISRDYVSSIFREHPELFTHVFTDDEQRMYYSAA